MNTLLGPIVTADELCAAVEATLRAHLEPAAAALGLGAVQEWQQDPSEDALTSAAVPAVSISSSGDADGPRRHAQGYEIDFRISVAVYDRGESHADTQYRIRTWAALLSAALMQHKKLGGAAKDSVLIEQRIVDPGRGRARTLGGCAVTIDVEPADLALLHVAPPIPAPALGTVQTTNTTVTRQ